MDNTTMTTPDPGDIRSQECLGTAASLAIRGGGGHIQGARGHFRPERKLLAIELWPWPSHETAVSLHAIEMAVCTWQHLPTDWTVRAFISRREPNDPWANRRR